MPATLEAESTLTDHGQTTVPEAVRRALGLRKGDKLRYGIRPSGEMVLTRATSPSGGDPVPGPSLQYQAHDMASPPERFRAVDAECVQRLQSVVGDIDTERDRAPSADKAWAAGGRHPVL